MEFEKSLFIFRRDLRLQDNLALLEACERSKQVLPIFIFDPRQLCPHPFRSETGMQFLFKSLEDLEQTLEKQGSKLTYLHGIAEEILPKLINDLGINAVFCSKDYTPFSRKRDASLKAQCNKNKSEFFSLPNILLNEPENIRSQSKTPYTVFTFFFKTAFKLDVAPANIKSPKNLGKIENKLSLPIFSVAEAKDRYNLTQNPNLFVKGGRDEALKLMKAMPNFAEYKEQRNFPALSATTGLSAHNKFGTISIRELYHSIKDCFGAEHTMLSELYWRDFFTHIGFNFPHVFEGAFNKSYDKIEWEDNDRFLEAWQTGQTGFPIVDAGMRELNQTGFMHNRVRMIVASFLCKDLLLDWHHGERYFARKLLDYDPAVNNGNWQWAASTGCDAQPYFRIFNPWLQGEKFDKDAVYIKRWVTELAGIKPKQIHQLFKDQSCRPANYPAPIVEHAEQKMRAQRLFEMIK